MQHRIPLSRRHTHSRAPLGAAKTPHPAHPLEDSIFRCCVSMVPLQGQGVLEKDPLGRHHFTARRPARKQTLPVFANPDHLSGTSPGNGVSIPTDQEETIVDQRADITLNGNGLSLEDIVAIGTGEKKVSLEEEALQRCRESRSFLKEELNANRVIYGVNTSFGPLCKNIIRRDEIDRLQLNLIRSHAAGLGEPIAPPIALAVLAVRLNSL